ncbi:MAG: SH3 domain-containing protein [Bacteriovoracaceae bacterium]|nr:SH3 domain-containing protein [Bacteriovoracaceae bacterium]
MKNIRAFFYISVIAACFLTLNFSIAGNAFYQEDQTASELPQSPVLKPVYRPVVKAVKKVQYQKVKKAPRAPVIKTSQSSHFSFPEAEYTIAAKNGANLKEAPNVYSQSIAFVPNNSSVKVSSSRDDWSYVEGYYEGWVASQFLQETSQAGKYRIAVRRGSLNMRSAPSTKSMRVAQIPRGTVVIVNKVTRQWSKIYWYYEGWLQTYLLQKIARKPSPISSWWSSLFKKNTKSSPPPKKSNMYKVTARNGVNLRQTPSTSGKLLTVVPNRALVKATQHKKDWIKVKGSLKGWIPSEFLQVSSTGTYRIDLDQRTFELKASPSYQARGVGKISNYSTVEVRDSRNDWHLVTLNYHGWVFTKFLQNTYRAPAAGTKFYSEYIFNIEDQRGFIGLGILKSIIDEDNIIPSVAPMTLGYDFPIEKHTKAWWAVDIRAAVQFYSHFSATTGLNAFGLYLGPLWYLKFSKHSKHAISMATCAGISYLSGNSTYNDTAFNTVNLSFVWSLAYEYQTKKLIISPEFLATYIYDTQYPTLQAGASLNIIYPFK